jgi:hypothetical protein
MHVSGEPSQSSALSFGSLSEDFTFAEATTPRKRTTGRLVAAGAAAFGHLVFEQ